MFHVVYLIYLKTLTHEGNFALFLQRKNEPIIFINTDYK